MKTFSNAQVASVLDVPSVVAALQPRARLGLGDVKFSAMSEMRGSHRRRLD
ncbi:Delta(1)-pyrroline-2-carboxylate reductase [Pandoraea cepalis]|uniref:Delta(1)-pyrroline-2-carboxylate reductase n=1 Tax=Pandoraea cepalis TaxID=2508294 RepID=A0A5E4W0J9_9BURK|nr:hypothetical protein [Pandoraea cepalis]VVE18162.1 Delta(1)-pyrroline-2-carboxylate reductase [Pandoraea cepalis]